MPIRNETTIWREYCIIDNKMPEIVNDLEEVSFLAGKHMALSWVLKMVERLQ